MSISTYSELQTAVANWLNRSDLTLRIPEFIALAESRISKELRISQTDKRATSVTVAAQEYYPLPSDFVSAISLTLETSSAHRLTYLPNDQLQQKYPTSPSGIPDSYSIVGNTFRLVPIPNSAWTMTLVYKARLSALSGTNTTNHVLTNHPEIYLYGALIEAEPFLLNDPRIQTWIGLFDRAIHAARRNAFFAPSNPYVRCE